jgi:hypothetical protein
MLRSNEVDAVLLTDDADGWYPHVGFVQGYRVLVLDSDEDEARRLLREAEPLAEG